VELFESATYVFMRVAWRLEFFFPQLAGFYIKHKLKQYKDNNLITNYKVKPRRRGKYRYSFDVDLIFGKQNRK
jgi:hypothetical protein